MSGGAGSSARKQGQETLLSGCLGVPRAKALSAVTASLQQPKEAVSGARQNYPVLQLLLL